MKTLKHKCPPHYFIVNSTNVGVCKYCGEGRNFEKLRRQAEKSVVVVGSGPASLKRVVKPSHKRGRKKKEEN